MPLPDLTPVLRDLFVHPTSETRGKDARILFFQHLNHTRHCFKKYKRKKKKKKYGCRGAALGKGVLPHPEDFLWTPPYFLWAATNGLKSSDPSISQFYDCGKKKLKVDEFLSVLWVINLKKERKRTKNSGYPCHDFSCRLSPSDQLELFLNFNTIRGYIRESVFMYVYIYLCVI